MTKPLLLFLTLLSPVMLISCRELCTTTHIDYRVLEGAKKEMRKGTQYNTDMLRSFYPPVYSNGNKHNKSIYPNGDVNPYQGVCSDLVVRALRNAGYDLQKQVHEDIKQSRKYYGVSKPNRYIDHRRVRILQKFFSKNFQSLPLKTQGDFTQWRPGDIVIWDTGSKTHLHIGIISDRTTGISKRPLVIHNARYVPFVFPGRTREQDVLNGITKLGIRIRRWKAIGHFRLSDLK